MLRKEEIRIIVKLENQDSGKKERRLKGGRIASEEANGVRSLPYSLPKIK